MKDIQDSSIIICSIVRNAEKGLTRNIPIIKAICSKFKSYKVIIYENDSNDRTKAILNSWQNDDKEHVIALLNNTDNTRTIPSAKNANGANPFYSKIRINKMATLRNHYMEWIDENIPEKYDYFMVVDLDVAQLYFDNILTSFADDIPKWDVVTAYGFSLAPSLKRRFHDTYALCLLGDENKPQTEKMIHDTAIDMAKTLEKSEWKKVFSAFGGLAIYKYELVKGLRYTVLPNNDTRVQVRCEHYGLIKKMIERKPDLNVYINPKMKLKYQDVTLKVIWGSITRKLGIGI